VLVDTSVWIDHFRRGNVVLRTELEEGDVVTHEFVIGELACGNLRNRSEILGLLSSLPILPTVPHDEVLELVSRRHLAGRGLGWIDMHLLASAWVSGVALLTLDKRLARFSRRT
jgi:predicted nucleic acid-binding protein